MSKQICSLCRGAKVIFGAAPMEDRTSESVLRTIVCPMCLGAIYWARPDRIYFANTKEDAAAIQFDDHFIYQELALPYSERTLPTVHIMNEEAKVAFQKWMESEDKVEY